MKTRPDLDVTPVELEAVLALLATTIVGINRDRSGPIVPPRLSKNVRDLLNAALPEMGVGIERTAHDIVEQLLPDATKTTDPRFLGLITTGSNPYGLVAEIAAAAMNQHVARREISPLASAIEDQALRWLGAFIGFDENASGIFTSGGSTANFTALAAARQAKAPFNVAQVGLRVGPQLVAYTSDEAHLSVDKAVAALGLGRDNLRRIETHEDFTINIDALARAIAQDRANGAHPFCVTANAGAVNTGAIDDLNALADLCEMQGLWLHVDAAYGGPAAGTNLVGPLFAGLSRAHSVTVDAHKWLYTPYECAGVLVHDDKAQQATFTHSAPYAASATTGSNYMDSGLQMSRDLKALKVWALFRGAGAALVRRAIEDDILAIRDLGAQIDAHPRLQRLAPIPLSTVCFRYVPAGKHDEAYLDALNTALAREILSDGRIFLGATRVRGRVGLRACCVDYRFDGDVAKDVLDTILSLGAKADASLRSQ